MTTIVPAPERPLLPRGLVILLPLAAATIVIAGMKGASGLIGPSLLALHALTSSLDLGKLTALLTSPRDPGAARGRRRRHGVGDRDLQRHNLGRSPVHDCGGQSSGIVTISSTVMPIVWR